MSSLGEQLPAEMTRVRELVEENAKLGPAGNFARFMHKRALDDAQKALASGDVVAMIQAYERLKECQ
jgi:molybdopterin converting factor small subunit